MEGPPGTGKSQTIANLLCHFAANGHKTLFVSQKPQALKIVKDKLKAAGLHQFFGYLPNTASRMLDETDISDGVGLQLSRLEEVIREEEAGSAARKDSRNLPDVCAIESQSVGAAQDGEDALKRAADEAVEEQRTFAKLMEESIRLAQYDFDVEDFELFAERLDSEQYEQIRERLVFREKLSARKDRYEGQSAQLKALFDKRFSHIGDGYGAISEAVADLADSVAEMAYDGENFLHRWYQRICFMWRHRNVLSGVPREVRDYVHSLFSRDLSRSELALYLGELSSYFAYREDVCDCEQVKEMVGQLLGQCGLTEEQFGHLERLVSAVGFTRAKAGAVELRDCVKRLGSLRLADAAEVSKKYCATRRERLQRRASYVQNRVLGAIREKMNSRPFRKALRQLARKLSKSKRAFKTFQQLKRERLDDVVRILDIYPVWIMELDDASRLLPLRASLFDYVVFDEASQCNVAYALPSMFRAKRAIFFGDRKQMRDDSIRFKSNRAFRELASKYDIPDHLRIKAEEEAVKSVLEIAHLAGFKEAALLHHYRSPKELIGFSNKYFYAPERRRLIVLNTDYRVFEDTSRIMLIHRVVPRQTQETGEKTNQAEAEKAVEIVSRVRKNANLKECSIGILSFFNEQANLIRDRVSREFGAEAPAVSIVEGIQGDEKDIIIISFVIKSPAEKMRYVALTGEGGTVNRELNAGRVNVAFSRARLQVHCIVSMEVEEFPEGIWIKRYLRYVEDHGKIEVNETQLKPFGSDFEKDFYDLARNGLGEGFLIQNQVECCGFRIDFVVTDLETGRKVAVECDGPSHFDEGDGTVRVDSDIEREVILRTATRWPFVRIRYSDWVNKEYDRMDAIRRIKKAVRS